MTGINLRRFVIFMFFSFVILTIFSVNVFAEEEYKFERMWPTLQQPWYFDIPMDVALDEHGNVYVVDTANDRIQKFTSDGQFVAKWGKHGDGDGEFSSPYGAVVDGGYVYVTDKWHDCVRKFSLDGRFLATWGQEGAGDGQFRCPYGLASDRKGYVYVADTDNHRIQKFSSEGLFVAKWGTEGSGDGQFRFPTAITVDANGHIYVIDADNHRIQKFSSNGAFLLKWGTEGSGDGQFDFKTESDPARGGITVDAAGNVYVSDTGNGRVQKFSSKGQFVAKFGMQEWQRASDDDLVFYNPVGLAIDNDDNVFVADAGDSRVVKFNAVQLLANWGGPAQDAGKFDKPSGIAIGSDGCVYTTDEGNDRVQKFSSDGRLMGTWGGEGTEDSQFHNPAGIATDTNNNLYVVDTGNNRIQKFSSDGEFMAKWGTEGHGQGELSSPHGAAVDSSGYVYVTDTDNSRIQKFSADGTSVLSWGSAGKGDGEFEYPVGIAVDNKGYVYVADTNNDRIQKFTSGGDFVAKWSGEFGTGEKLNDPWGVAVDDEGYVYVTDIWNYRILKLTSEGEFVAGIGSIGSDPGMFNAPLSVALGPDGQIYVCEFPNNRIQVLKKVATGSNNRAIIVAGGGPYPGNNLWDSTQMCANFAYRTLTYQGFTKESIYYLTSDTNLDLDSNGVLDDVDGDAANSNLRHAITGWAEGADSVLLYLTDHGGAGTFRMSGTETLSATELDAWLDTLQTTMSGKVIVVYDACESGSFLPMLTPPAGKERIVMTSTSPDETAKFVTQGSISFSNYFWTHIFNGVNILDAFDLTRAALSISFNDQNPLVDADGNGVGNEIEDYALISNVYIGNGTEIYGDAPVIGSVSEDQMITGVASAVLSASKVTDDDGISRVWAVIRPPDYGQGALDNPVTELPSVDLIPMGGGQYEGVYTDFNIAGTYQIAIYARDRIGNTSIPKLTTVSVENPLRRRAVIVIGASQTDESWPVIQQSASMAYQALNYQGYTDDDIYFMSPMAFSTGHDASSTLSNFAYAINTWCMEDTQDLVLYMVGNGGVETFHINDTESLSAAELGLWLDALQEAIPGKVTVIYDGCLSGSFLPVLSPPADRSRILISSTSASQPAYFLYEGNLSFSNFFWPQVLNGANIRDAFFHGKDALAFTGEQIPQLDDTGNGVGNEKKDGNLAKNTTFGTGIMLAGDDPIVGSISPSQTLYEEISATIWAKDVTSTGIIDRVWAVITPPNHITGSGIPVTDLPTMDLTSVGNNRYAGTYAHFTLSGTYNIAVFAMDREGALSLPVQTAVTIIGSAGCLSVSNDLTISVPCAEYGAQQFGFALNFYPNPEDSSGLYWKLDTATLAGGTGTDCIRIGADLSIPISCVAYNGAQYGFTLGFYNNPSDPSGLYWKMNISSFEVK